MNKELTKSLHSAFSRSKKHNTIQYIVPTYNSYTISKYSFSANGIRIFYSIDSNGIINKHDDEKIFNLGSIDFLNVSGYV